MSFLTYLKIASPRIPGKVVTVLPSGNAFIETGFVFPLSDGSNVKSFFVPKDSAPKISVGNYVSFCWENAGEAGFDTFLQKKASPTASEVKKISRSEWETLSKALKVRKEVLEGFNVESRLEIRELERRVEEILEDTDSSIAIAVELLKEEAIVEEQVERKKKKLGELEEKAKNLTEGLLQKKKAKQLILQEITLLRQKQEKLQQKLEEHEETIKCIQRIGLGDSEKRSDPSLPDTTWPLSLDELEKAIGNIATPLVRRTAILAALCSVLEGRLLLFDGAVGTGKTTLAERIACVLGGTEAVIPVRPAWLEPADLIGYFDPLSRVFRPGPLLEACGDAEDDRVFVTVLDELNLARIENYASDVLSRLERTSSNTKVCIAAWSKSECQALLAESSLLNEISDRTPEQESRLKRVEASLDYLPDIELPEGTIFVGTLNTDETTYDLSPKVIDRSFSLSFSHPQFSSFETDFVEPTEGLSLKMLRDKIGSKGTELWDKVLKLCSAEDMAELGIPYSYRVFRDAGVFEQVGKALGLTVKEMLPMFLFSRVLPRIRFFKTSERKKKANDILGKMYNCPLGERDPAWENLFGRFKLQLDANDNTIVRFWRSAT